jgi:hypothetical protein
MPVPSRRAARAAALLLSPVVLTVALAGPAAAAPPASWPVGDDTSTLDHLLLIFGAPLGLALLIALLVVAPSLARKSAYRSFVPWYAEAQHYGTEPTAESSTDAVIESTTGGGASVRW